MTETPTPAQDLAAIDRVVDLALAVDLITEEFAETLDRLRAPIALELDRRRALRDALVAEWRWDGRDETVTDKATERVLAAIASVGAEIVWPTQGPAPEGDRAAGDATAPETGGVSAEHRMCAKNPSCIRPVGHDGDCMWMHNNITAERLDGNR